MMILTLEAIRNDSGRGKGSEGLAHAESRFLVGGIPGPVGSLAEGLGRRILARIILVGRLGVCYMGSYHISTNYEFKNKCLIQNTLQFL